MLREIYNSKTNSCKMVPCKSEHLMNKVTNRKFEYEGKTFALEDHIRYRGYRLNRTDKHTSGMSHQDLNLDINDEKKTVYTECNSIEQFYELTEEEYKQFKEELESRVTK